MVCTWYVHDMHMVHGWWYGMACDSQCVEAIVPGWPWQILTDLDRSWQVAAVEFHRPGHGHTACRTLYTRKRCASPRSKCIFFRSVLLVRDRLNEVESGWYILNHFDRICTVGGIESLSRSSIGGMAAMYLAGCCFRAWLLPQGGQNFAASGASGA